MKTLTLRQAPRRESIHPALDRARLTIRPDLRCRLPVVTEPIVAQPASQPPQADATPDTWMAEALARQAARRAEAAQAAEAEARIAKAVQATREAIATSEPQPAIEPAPWALATWQLATMALSLGAGVTAMHWGCTFLERMIGR